MSKVSITANFREPYAEETCYFCNVAIASTTVELSGIRLKYKSPTLILDSDCLLQIYQLITKALGANGATRDN